MAIYYRYDDAGAPQISGTGGSLIAILDACLVNGYGAKAAAGWAKPYQTTNVAAYRAPAGNRFYCRVDDTSGAVARVFGTETMTDINAYTGQFPSNTQANGGQYIHKSSTADATLRSWVLVANDRFFIMIIQSTSSIWAALDYQFCGGHWAFGEIVSYKPGDQYNTVLIACPSATQAANSVLGQISRNANPVISGHHFARSALQIGIPVAFNKVIANDPSDHANGAIGGYSAYTPYPDPITGGVLTSPILLTEFIQNRILVRGRLPGLWAMLHHYGFNHGDVIPGTGDLAGKSFLVVRLSGAGSSSLYSGNALLEISDTW